MQLGQIGKTQTSRLFQCTFIAPVNGLVVDLPLSLRPMLISQALPTAIYRYYCQPILYRQQHSVSSFDSTEIFNRHVHT